MPGKPLFGKILPSFCTIYLKNDECYILCRRNFDQYAALKHAIKTMGAEIVSDFMCKELIIDDSVTKYEGPIQCSAGSSIGCGNEKNRAIVNYKNKPKPDSSDISMMEKYVMNNAMAMTMEIPVEWAIWDMNLTIKWINGDGVVISTAQSSDGLPVVHALKKLKQDRPKLSTSCKINFFR